MDESYLPNATIGSIVNDQNGNQVLAYKGGDPNILSVKNEVGQPADVSIVKVARDQDGNITTNKLAGAKFHLLNGHDLVTNPQLTAIDETEEPIAIDANGVFTVPRNGLTINNLEPGTYTLVEDLAPNGYIIDVGSFSFTVNQDGTVTSVYADGLTLTIPNPPGAELPEAGGPGTYLYTLCGLALFAAAGYIGFVSRRSSRKEVV